MNEETKQKQHSRSRKGMIIYGGIMVLLLSGAGVLYALQHKQVSNLKSQLATLSTKTSKLDKDNKSLSGQVGDLTKANQLLETANNKLTAAASAGTQSDNVQAVPEAPTSTIQLTKADLVPTSDYTAYAADYPDYQRFTFTIKNNSSQTQTYSLMSDSYIYAISDSGEVIKPVITYSSKEWYSSTLTPGGTASDVQALFPGGVKITKPESRN